MGTADVVVDCAGAVMGGALRYLQELDGYLARQQAAVRQIGRGYRVSLPWLAQRELRAERCQHTVALNNLAFAGAGRMKTVLLRNALHFLSEEERVNVAVSPALYGQSLMVRALMKRADRIVVPTTSMAERVCRVQRSAAERLRVMHHPVTLLPPPTERDDVILCPVLDAPYKMLGARLAAVIAGVQTVREETEYGKIELLLTLSAGEASALRLPLPPFVRLLGRITPDALKIAQQSARVILYPTTLESFGYPLAEARLGRQPVIAPDTLHAREVAADALVGYRANDHASLKDAIRSAFSLKLPPLGVNPFDPDAYFDLLFSPSWNDRGSASV